MIHEEAGGLIKSCLGLRSVMRWLRCYFFFYPTARSIRVGSDGVEVIVELARDGLVDGRVEGGRRHRGAHSGDEERLLQRVRITVTNVGCYSMQWQIHATYTISYFTHYLIG